MKQETLIGTKEQEGSDSVRQIGITQTNIKKDDDPLNIFNGYTQEGVEDRTKIKPLSKTNVKKALEEYKEYLSSKFNDKFFFVPKNILSDTEINSFIQVVYEEYGSMLGRGYLNKLINVSYNAGYNNFYLNLTSFDPMDGLLSNLKAKENDMVSIYIDGSLGDGCVIASSNLELFVNGNVGNNFVSHLSDSRVFVDGNAGSFFGINSTNCLVRVNGNVGYNLGCSSIDLTAYISGTYDVVYGKNSSDLIMLEKKEVKQYPLFKEMKKKFTSKFK